MVLTLWHRLGAAARQIETAAKSFRVIRKLTTEQVDAFMNSYIIYDLDWADSKAMEARLGADYQHKVGEHLEAYYCVLNHLCAVGGIEKMYIPPVVDSGEGIAQNQILYERTIARTLALPRDAETKILELGCGRGRVAAHMSTLLPRAQVIGINIDADQVASARAFNEERGFANSFLCRDFNDLPLPFPDEYFDGFYQIQAFSLAKDVGALCIELHRVLKPGARLSLLDWASLPAYNPEDAHHQHLMRSIKPLIGAVGTPTPTSLERDLQLAGLGAISSSNASVATQGLQTPLIKRVDKSFVLVKNLLLALVWIGLLPSHFRTLFLRLTHGCDALVEADSNRLVTMSYQWTARKPI